MTKIFKEPMYLINTYRHLGAHAHSTSMECFQQLPSAPMLKQKLFKRLSASARHHTSLKAGVNKIQGYARKRDS